MRNITPFRKRNFLDSYLQTQNERQVFHRAFFLGVMSTLVAPQLIFCFFFGSSFAVVFGACALGGSVLGVRAYRRFASPFVELKLGLVEQPPRALKPRLKKAA